MFISCPTVGMVRTANRRVQSGTRCSHPEWGHCKKKEMPGYTLRPYCSSYHKPQEKKLLYKCNNYIQSIFLKFQRTLYQNYAKFTYLTIFLKTRSLYMISKPFMKENFVSGIEQFRSLWSTSRFNLVKESSVYLSKGDKS